MRPENGIAAAPPSADSMARALEQYLAAAEAGAAPPREEFLARYPDLAQDLDACLSVLHFIGRAGDGPRSLAAEVAGTQPPEQATGQLGDFRLIREVGRGGMGVVYEAEQISLGRRVALKVLPFAATMDPRQLQRFQNEARAAASLDHPHIVHVHAVGCERAVHYYAMQFIEGQTLAALIAGLRRPGDPAAASEAEPTTAHVPEAPAAPAADTAAPAAAATERAPRDRDAFRRVAELGIQAAEALDHAHALGIVHRDVKPANLLVDGRGGLWVTDFGLAQVQSDARLTLTGDLVGTLRYMSPEQALAQRVVIDHRTDIYSLGATLYELLTLAPAFGGNDRQELLRQIAFEEPVRPRRRNRAIPAELETIVLKALEKNPAERYATAKELAEDLRRWLADEPIRARRAGVVRRLRKWGRRHRAWVASAAALGLALLALGGVALWRELGQQAAAENAALVALERAELLQQQERWDEALAVLAVAQGQLEGRGLGALRQRLEQSQRDVEILQKLEEARLQMAAGGKESDFDYAGADRLYTAAFQGYGLDISTLDPSEAAKRIRASAICAPLVVALDEWTLVRRDLKPGTGDPLRAVAARADDDPWRRRLRDAAARADRASLEELAAERDVVSKPSVSLHQLAIFLRRAGSSPTAERLLRQAQAAHPADFWINFRLALLLNDTNPAVAIRFHQAALALRPNSPIVYNNFGVAFWILEKRVAAETAYRAALRLNKNYPQAHLNLGQVRQYKGDVDGAIAEYREAIRISKDFAEAHYNLGVALGDKGDLDGAIAACREAIRLKKDYAEAHNNLGSALRGKGDIDAAVTEWRAALRIDKAHFGAHYNLGIALEYKGDLDGAIVEYREALRSNKDFAEAHCNLGGALRQKGQLAKALTHLRRGHELGSTDPRWRYPSAQWVKECERLCERLGEAERKLPVILSGQEPAGDALLRARCAEVCQMRHLYAASARLYREAMTAKPDLVASPVNSVRYNAACAAALAGCGKGEDVAKLTDAERAALRKHALEWLGADLGLWQKQLDGGADQGRLRVQKTMQHWLGDADFNGVRGPDALGKLPAAEREGWQQLWADVAATLARAQQKSRRVERQVSPTEGRDKK
jgi:serine/threonine protein kinase/tetratricopeptide (TPR) repeat protein